VQVILITIITSIRARLTIGPTADDSMRNHTSDSLFVRAVCGMVCWTLVLALTYGCSTNNGQRQCEVNTYVAGLSVNEWHQFYDLTVYCPRGQQMLGGGYSVSDAGKLVQLGPEVPDDNLVLKRAGEWNKEHPGQILKVIASYPSADNAWTVTAANGDQPPKPGEGYSGYNVGALVSAYCTCATSDADFGMDTKVSEATSSAVDLSVPEGAVVTGGGFRDEEDGYVEKSLSGNIIANRPLTNSTGDAVGWRVVKSSVEQIASPPVTAYVRYATKGLQASKVRTEVVDPNGLTGGTLRLWDANCQDDEFTSGGGYEFANMASSIDGYWVQDNHARLGEGAWQIGAVYFPPAALTMSALCIKVPASQLHVEITQPHAGECIHVSESDKAASVPTIFQAVASFGCTNVDAELSWNLSTWDTSRNPTHGIWLGYPFRWQWQGNGASRVLRLWPPRLQRYTVSVTAKYQGHEATAEIEFDAGCAPVAVP
jgi:hypothetical protein